MEYQDTVNKLFSLAEKRAKNSRDLETLLEKLPDFDVKKRQREGAEHIIMLMEEVLEITENASY